MLVAIVMPNRCMTPYVLASIGLICNWTASNGFLAVLYVKPKGLGTGGTRSCIPAPRPGDPWLAGQSTSSWGCLRVQVGRPCALSQYVHVPNSLSCIPSHVGQLQSWLSGFTLTLLQSTVSLGLLGLTMGLNSLVTLVTC